MAKPQLEQGCVAFALDLYAAIEALDLANRERIVLAEVLLQCYGPQKRLVVTLGFSDIERSSGLSRANAHRGFLSLVERNILIRTSSEEVRFNKDYESWKIADTRPRKKESVRELLLRFARTSLNRFMNPVPSYSPETTPRARRVFPRDNAGTSRRIPQGIREERAAYSLGNTEAPSQHLGQNGVSQGGMATSENIKVQGPILKNPGIELNSIQHQHPPTPLEGGDAGGGATLNPRNPDDAADIASAVGVLKASPTTRDLADELARKHDRNGNLRTIEGWRFLVAAGELRRAKAGAVGMGLLVTKAREASRADLGALVAPRRPAEVLPEVLRADPNSPAVLANARLKARALKDERNPI